MAKHIQSQIRKEGGGKKQHAHDQINGQRTGYAPELISVQQDRK